MDRIPILPSHVRIIRGGPRAWPPTTRIAAAIIITTTLALLVAACGAGKPASGTSGLTGTSTAAISQAVAFTRCMRSHGVLNFPDPNGSGTIPKVSSQQLGVSSTVFLTAQNHCRYLLPNGGSGPSQTQVQQIMSGMLKFARCMR